MDISVIISLLNEQDSLRELTIRITESLKDLTADYEILFIDDGSTDNSWGIISELASEDERIKGISFRRNYGKTAALQTGFRQALGDVVVTLDADLQDFPEEIPTLYKMIAEQNYDLVSGWKKKRKDNVLTKNLPSRIYNFSARRVTGLKLHDMNCGLKAFKKEVVENIELYGDMHRYIPYLALQAGYDKIGEVAVKHSPRRYGKSKFGTSRFFNGFLDLLTLWFISTFGKKPMHLFGVVGLLTFFTGFCISLWLILDKVISQSKGLKFRAVTDQPLFYVALVALIIGVLLFLTGFIGELIVRSGSEKNKYNIKEKIR